MKPKLILFDFYGTLAYLKKFNSEDLFAFLENLGLSFNKKEEKDYFLSLFSKIFGLSKDWIDFSKKILKNYIKKPLKSSIQDLSNFLKENVIFELYDDAKEIFNLPFPKAILTASSKFSIENLGLESFFKIFTPRETKFLKPDKRAFLAVLDFFRIEPKKCLMIGDEIERDLIPAKNVGMETILIDRENKIENPPVKKINSLAELKNLLI